MKLVRMFAATTSGIFTGLINLISGRIEGPHIELKPGDTAPDFSLAGSDGRWYRLSDFHGMDAVVLAWFPKAFTPHCTRECASLGSSHGVLRGFKAKYFGVSVDTVETNRQFARSLGLDYPILSDTDKRVAQSYGVLSATGFPARWTFYIGKDGQILDVDKNVHPKSHGPDVARRLAELSVPADRTGNSMKNVRTG